MNRSVRRWLGAAKATAFPGVAVFDKFHSVVVQVQEDKACLELRVILTLDFT